MPKRAEHSHEEVNLLLFPSSAEPSVLTLAEDSPVAQPPATLGAQTPKQPKVRKLRSKLGAQLDAPKSKTGRPDAQRQKFDSSEECTYASRAGKERLSLRVDPQVLRTVKKECGTVYPPLKLYQVTEDAWRLWLRARAEAKLGAQTPTCSSGSSSGSSSHEIDLNPNLDQTTTTTLGAQTPKTVALPGFAADILNLNQKSKHSAEINFAYAWDEHRSDGSIKKPDLWAASNLRTGKYDGLVDLWLVRKQEEEDERLRREAARQLEEMRIREEVEEMKQRRLETERREEEERRASNGGIQ